MTGRTKRNSQRVRALLAAFADGLSVRSACAAAGIGRSTMYEWLEADPALKAAYHDAYEDGTDLLEDIAVDRAKSTSDTLMTIMLKARRPDKYRDRSSTDLNLAGGVTVKIEGDDAAL